MKTIAIVEAEPPIMRIKARLSAAESNLPDVVIHTEVKRLNNLTCLDVLELLTVSDAPNGGMDVEFNVIKGN